MFTRDNSSVFMGSEKSIIISDIWGLWDYVVKKHRTDKWYLLSLLDQAKTFYQAAEAVPVRSKPLLFYYSFLNLAKIILNIEYGYGSSVEYIHGIGERNNTTFGTSTIMLQPSSPLPRVKVGTELLRFFDGSTPTGNTNVRITDLLRHCAGVHRSFSETYQLPENLHKLDQIEFYRQGRTIGIKTEIKCPTSEIVRLQNIGYNITLVNNKPIWDEHITMHSYTPSRQSYFDLSRQFMQKGVWYLIGSNGYSMYVSSNANARYSTEVIIYDTIFYLGSITRYRPELFDQIFNAKEQWLMSEFLSTQPKQFLYLATAKVLGQNVLKAYSNF